MGVTYDSNEQTFVFDFEHDGTNDTLTLTGDGYQVEAFGKCFFYGYEFSDLVDGAVRSAFIKHVKFTDNLQEDPNLTHFIKKAIDGLHRQINLYGNFYPLRTDTRSVPTCGSSYINNNKQKTK